VPIIFEEAQSEIDTMANAFDPLLDQSPIPAPLSPRLTALLPTLGVQLREPIDGHAHE
jgi:hypothetical protein